ncbi:MAG: hypothetical protein IPM39_24560 [Chloroflexi bacterium]|nr:hypothetical protein [Chloroflexota bacterium]
MQRACRVWLTLVWLTDGDLFVSLARDGRFLGTTGGANLARTGGGDWF